MLSICSGSAHRGGSGSVLLAVAAALLASIALGPSPSLAQSPDLWAQSGAGASASENGWIVYSSTTVAPSSHLYESGWRLRATFGHGGYTVTSPPVCTSNQLTGQRKCVETDIDARATFSDALVGYLSRHGYLTAKAFAGISYIDHDLPRPLFGKDRPSGSDWGPKLVGELWYDPGSSYWASFNAGFTAAHDTFAFSTRLGYRLTDQLSIGPEFQFDRNAWSELDFSGLDESLIRGGIFARYAWEGGEISVSAGIAREGLAEETSPHASVNWLSKF